MTAPNPNPVVPIADGPEYGYWGQVTDPRPNSDYTAPREPAPQPEPEPEALDVEPSSATLEH